MKNRKLCILVLIAVVMTVSTPLSAADQCYLCHKSNSDKVSSLFMKDIHFNKGISCAGCHGGNSTSDDMDKAMNKAEGFRGVPKGDAISRTCAACHTDSVKMKQFGSILPTDQWAKLQESVHAGSSVKGKEHVVQCVTCHNAHGIVSVKNPTSPVYPLNSVKTCAKCHADIAYMKAYNPVIAVDQLEKYRTSVHGKRNAGGDPKAAVCTSCHGSHGIHTAKDATSDINPLNLPKTCAKCHSNAAYMKGYNIPTDQYEKYAKSVHGIALMQKHDIAAPVCNSCHGNHGAAPPALESVSKVCGTCHALNEELFSGSPHKKAFDDRKLPECETCHGNHEIIRATDKLLGVAAEAVCTRCHLSNQNTKGYEGAKLMRSLIDSLERSEAFAKSLIEDAEQKGMEITEAKFKLRDVRQARLQARTTVHAFNVPKFQETVNNGFAIVTTITADGKNAIDEYYFRRLGLGISTLIISLIAVALFLYIRRIEKK
jgi:predicted CXXCH cytochrome family protein